MKKVIITGANGFIGRYLVNELLNNDYEVWAVIRNEKSNVVGMPEGNIHYVYCELNNIKELVHLIPERGFACFYHLAWEGNSGEKRSNYSLQLRNAEACVNAAIAADALQCKRFVGAGSITELMYKDYLGQDKSTPDMVTCYAIGKMAAEYLTKCQCNDLKIEFVWTYISNFYGVGDTTKNFINFLIKSYSERIVPQLTSGEQYADFMYVTDVARALIAVAERGHENTSYYIGYGQPQPLKEFVVLIKNMICPSLDTGLGKKEFHGISVDFDNIDYKKLQRDTGFEPSITFETGIEKTIKWFKIMN